jgi:chromosome segregation ATPase
MTCITESDFIARVEGLIAELERRRDTDGDLQCRWNEALMEGYTRALALEGRRRRLRERQRELADLPEPSNAAMRQLTALTRSEASLRRQEHELRALLVSLRAALVELADVAHHEMMPRRSA